MSNLSRFMKSNKVQKKNGEYAPTKSMIGSDGNPLRWEFKHIGSKMNETIRDDCTIDVQIKGKPNMYRPKLDTSEYLVRMIVASTVVPDLYNKELQDSYGVKKPEDLVYEMVDDPGEYQDLCTWVQNFQGFSDSLDEKVDEAKN